MRKQKKEKIRPSIFTKIQDEEQLSEFWTSAEAFQEVIQDSIPLLSDCFRYEYVWQEDEEDQEAEAEISPYGCSKQKFTLFESFIIKEFDHGEGPVVR